MIRKWSLASSNSPSRMEVSTEEVGDQKNDASYDSPLDDHSCIRIPPVPIIVGVVDTLSGGEKRWRHAVENDRLVAREPGDVR